MGHFAQRARSARGVYRRRNRRLRTSNASKHQLIIGGYGGIFWQNLCTEFDHTRTAQEISDGKIWSGVWDTSVEGVFQRAFRSQAYTKAVAVTRQSLWDDADTFFENVADEDWTTADVTRLAILAHTD